MKLIVNERDMSSFFFLCSSFNLQTGVSVSPPRDFGCSIRFNGAVHENNNNKKSPFLLQGVDTIQNVCTVNAGVLLLSHLYLLQNCPRRAFDFSCVGSPLLAKKKKKLSFLPGLLAEDLQVLEMRCVSWEEKNPSYIHVDVNVRLQITGSTR